MRPVSVDQRIRHKGPQLPAEAAGKNAAEHDGGVIAGRNEREEEQQLYVLVAGEHVSAHRMNERQHGQHSDNDRRDVEERFAFHGYPKACWAAQLPCLRGQPQAKFARKLARKKEGFRPPVSRALRGLRAFKALVTSPRLPRLFQSPRRMLELVATGALWIDDDVKPTPARCQLDLGLNTNWRWASGRRSHGTAPAPP